MCLMGAKEWELENFAVITLLSELVQGGQEIHIYLCAQTTVANYPTLDSVEYNETW